MSLLFKLDDWEIKKFHNVILIYHEDYGGHYSLTHAPFAIHKCSVCLQSTPEKIITRINFYKYLNKLL